MSWLVQTRGEIYLHRFGMALLAAADGRADKFYDSPITEVLFINVGPKLWFAWDEKQISDYGRVLIKKISRPATAGKHFKRIQRLCAAANAESEKIRLGNLTRLSNKDLARAYENLYKKTGHIQIVLGADIDAADFVFGKHLKELLQRDLKKSGNESGLEDIYKQLSAPAHLSYFNRQAQSTALAAAKKSNRDLAAQKLYDRFWWTPLGWENVRPHSLAYFKAKIEQAKTSKALNRLVKIAENQKNTILKHRQKLIKQYRLSKNFQYWLKLLDQYAHMHDLRKEMQVRNVYAFHLLLKETARRLKLKPLDLERLWYQEAGELLLGKKLSRADIGRRKQAFAVIIRNHKLKQYSGRPAISAKQKILRAISSQNKQISGMGVSRGVVKGHAKICSGYVEALKKIKKGDILITGMTLPDYLPAMKKAAAVVTDEGGLTCHAAIVCRELGKACVVGTKHASETFKDGDLLEVDANKGIVKKLS